MTAFNVTVFIFTILVVGIGLWKISKTKTERTTFVTGLCFILYGLVGSLYGGIIFGITDPDRLKTIGDTFLIIASIGANLVAASILLPSITSASSCTRGINNHSPEPTKTAGSQETNQQMQQ